MSSEKKPKSKATKRRRASAAPNPKSPWAATKADQRNARRDTILRAATRCINQLGYTGASMAIIARELGLSYNALYHYFESKEEILAQAFMRTNDLLLECVQRSADAPGSGMSRMLAFVDSFQRLVEEESPPALALVGHLPRQTLNKLLARREEFLERLQAVVRNGIEDGSIRTGEPSLMVAFIFGALENLPYWLYKPGVVSTSFQAFVRHALAGDSAAA